LIFRVSFVTDTNIFLHPYSFFSFIILFPLPVGNSP